MTIVNVDLTTSPAFSTFVRLVGDLPREMAAEDRYGALLEGLRAVFPCDAAALLRLEGDTLRPLAVAGLAHDTLGRRFHQADRHGFWRFRRFVLPLVRRPGGRCNRPVGPSDQPPQSGFPGE